MKFKNHRNRKAPQNSPIDELTCREVHSSIIKNDNQNKLTENQASRYESTQWKTKQIV